MRNKHLLTVSLLIFSAAYSFGCFSPAFAQEDMGDTMLMFVGEELYTISAASRREESVRKAPAAVKVLGRKELKQYRTLAEALNSVPGFYIDHSGIKEQIYLRGVADSFLVMIDGVPLANDSSNVDYPRGLDLSLDYIEKIEIVRGPGSALWGADAFSGVVNIVTRTGKDIGAQVSAQVGSDDTEGSTFLAGGEHGNVDALLFGSYVETKGFEPNHSGSSRGNDILRELYGKLSIGEHLTVSGRYSDYNNYYTINKLEAHRGQTNTPFSFIQATYEDTISNNLRAELKCYAHYFEKYLDEEYITPLEISGIPTVAPLEPRLKQTEWRYGTEANFIAEWHDKHDLTFGFSWEQDDAEDTTYDIQAIIFGNFGYHGTVSIYPDFRNTRLGTYIQDTYRLTDTFELTAGLRLDKHENYRRKISPRLSLAWYPSRELDFKLFYGQAYRTPDLYALSLDSGVKPEKITSYEGQLTYHSRNGFTLQGNYFYNVLNDLLENVTHGLGSQERREVEQGTELSLTVNPFRDLELYANHTFLFGQRQREDPRTLNLIFVTDDGFIPFTQSYVYHLAPNNVLRLGVTYTLEKHCTINVETTYVDSRDIDESFYGAEESSLSPYWSTDVNLTAQRLLDDRLDVSLHLRNIFDEEYEYRGEQELLEGPDRSAFLEIRWHF